MEPITLIMGLVALGSSAVGFVKQQEENDKAKAAADLLVQQTKADLAVQRANEDYGIVAAELTVKAEQVKAKRRVAELAAQRVQLEKNVLLIIAALSLLGAMILLVRHQRAFTGRRGIRGHYR